MIHLVDRSRHAALRADLLLVPFDSSDLRVRSSLEKISPSAAEGARRAIQLGDFDGKVGARFLLHSKEEGVPARILLLGLGEAKKQIKGALYKSLSPALRDPLFERVESVAVLVEEWGDARTLEIRVARLVDALLDGSYRWTMATEKKSAGPKSFAIHYRGAREAKAVTAGAQHGEAIGWAARRARDLANAPANVMSPEDLGKAALGLAKEYGLEAKVLGPRELVREKMHALLAVGEGSERKPCLIALRYHPPGVSRDTPPVALVGKGIVYDTGGVCIKPIESMVEMKFDKCGACVVLGAIAAVAKLRLPVPVVAIVPAAENLISGTAYRASDIVSSRAGKTIEVLNTDAEGRLVLADAIDYAITEFAPTAIFDVATLTGAAYYALGDLSCAIFGTDAALLSRVRAAGERAGERAWELPLTEDYRADVQTANADVRNTGAYGGGAIAGATFLQRFVRDTPWVHLDVASVSRDRRGGGRGATAFGLRLLVDMLSEWPASRNSGARKVRSSPPAKAARPRLASRRSPARARSARA